MPKVTSLDLFIERSCRLMEARPTSTVSITYGSEEKKAKQKPSPDKVSKKATTFVAVKTFDPQTGACFRIKLSKAKELSRVLTLLGPRGVQLTKTDPRAGLTPEALAGFTNEATATESMEPFGEMHGARRIVQERGIASLMTNVEFKEEVEPAATPVAEESTPAVETTAPKKKKKNNKKR